VSEIGLKVGYILEPCYDRIHESGYIHLLTNKYKEEISKSYIDWVKNGYSDYYIRINKLLEGMDEAL
jgi:hypothetical protein